MKKKENLILISKGKATETIEFEEQKSDTLSNVNIELSYIKFEIIKNQFVGLKSRELNKKIKRVKY